MEAGNGIQVVARLRPVNSKEKREGTPPVVSSNTAAQTVSVVKTTGKTQNKTSFKADSVFGFFFDRKQQQH